jgi:hypothetical protein
METALEGVLLKSSVMLFVFLWAKELNPKDFHENIFLFAVGGVCRVKQFTTGWKSFADDEEIEREVRKWLRQESKDFYVANFYAMVKRLDKCINVDGGYIGK